MSRYSYDSTTGELTLIAGNGYYNYIAPIETSPATVAHAKGSHILFNHNLCEATTDIAVNDTLAVGTNLRIVGTISNQIDSINDSLKPITTTLAANTTSVTIQDSRITTSSIIEPYSDMWGFNPTDITVTTGQCVLTFEAQDIAHTVGICIRYYL